MVISALPAVENHINNGKNQALLVYVSSNK